MLGRVAVVASEITFATWQWQDLERGKGQGSVGHPADDRRRAEIPTTPAAQQREDSSEKPDGINRN